MTPHQLANQQCAAMATDGSCLGVGIDDRLRSVRLWPAQACFVHQKRCTYFETCVAPSVRTMDEGKARDSWLQAIDLYLRRLPDLERGTAKVAIFGKAADEKRGDLTASRLCECGKPMEARHRYCAECSRRRRREANRAAQAAKRGVTVSS